MKNIRVLHKWVSLVVGLQFLIWLSTGLYFNLMDSTKASGNQYRQAIASQPEFDLTSLVAPDKILAKAPAAISIRLISLLNQPYYLLTHEQGLYPHFKNNYSLYDGYLAKKISIDANFAKALALQSYSGPGSVIASTLITSNIEGFAKQQNPVWQIGFDDAINTKVYIEQGSGRVVGHSDDDKRLADLFFTLHFMDYTNEGGFNNIAIMFMAFASLWLSITGGIWTWDLIKRGQLSLKRAVSVKA
ncbi:PepSY domain-containing protein [Thalassotalea aquiviva]|uniref:PepSY domain-containing protein n=1 Tax=Thalassotalea aquiviva TaxID=3242415 RepID=UPI00352A30F5